MFSLTGKRVIVTGGASGIGRASSLLFARAGAAVAVADRDEEGALHTSRDVISEGGRALAVGVDVTDAEQVQRMVDLTEEEFGGLDVMFANAGYASQPQSTLDLGEEVFDRTLLVNLKGVWLTARSAIPALQRSGGGSLIVTSSVMALKARPEYSAYGPAKAATAHLVRTLALEFAADNIRVNALAPAAVETPMLSTFAGDPASQSRDAFLEGIPLRRSVSPEEIAYAAIYLASDEASFITGVTLPIDGGRAV